MIAIDYGTAATVALLRRDDGTIEPVRFDGHEELPSAVYANPDATFETGRDATRRARIDPTRYRPAPKLDPQAARAVAATLRRVARAAPAARVVLTVPATWSPNRARALADAAVAAGMPPPALVPRPIAAAAYCTRLPGHTLPDGGAALVYHLGAGGFEATAVRRAGDGFEILATEPHPTGGLLLDELTAQRFEAALSPPGERRRSLLLDNARDAREALSRQDSIEALRSDAEPLTRAALEEALLPALAATVATAREVLAAAGLREVPWLLTGRASATPLVARLIGAAPLVLRHPRHAVVAGALYLDHPPDPAALYALDERRTYAVGGGHTTTTWHATPATAEELRQRYTETLPDHTESPPGRWTHERRDGGLRHFHHVTLFPATDPQAAGLGAEWRIPDHLRTVIRDDRAILPT